MNYNYNTKYKDRTPEETVALLQNFFEKRGFEIRIRDVRKSEADTWSCCLKLYYNNELVSIMTFGKSRFKSDNDDIEIIRF